MPRTAEQNQAIKDKRRSKLLSYALKAFAANGYDHTAIDDITKPSKCSHGLFYHYFESKEVVFRALIEDVILPEGTFPIEEALQLGGFEGLGLLLRFASSLQERGTRGIAIAKIIIDLNDATDLDEFGAEFAASHNLRGALVTLIAQGQEQGKVVDGNPEQIAQAIIDLLLASFERLRNKAGNLYGEELLLRFIEK